MDDESTGECVNTNIDIDGNMIFDDEGDSCDWYDSNPQGCGEYDTAEFNAGQMCCACNGGSTGGFTGFQM